MTILFDSQIFDLQKFGGISRYYSELYSRLMTDPDVTPLLSVIKSDNIHFNQIIKHSAINSTSGHDYFYRIYYKLFPDKIPKIVNKKHSIELLKQNSFDLFHPTYYDPYFLDYVKKPFVVTVYDMIYELFPLDFNTKEDEGIRHNKKALIEQASKLIAISYSTKKDLLKHYQIDENKIEVIHLASSFMESNSSISRNVNTSPYILFVGNRTKYKNFSFFVRSIHKILLSNKQLSIICVGPKFSNDEVILFRELGIEKQIFQRFPSDSELPELYRNALVFAFPSLYEGFGLPLLEAFNCGCPVICSNTSSFPEIVGDAALMFDPYSEKSISNALQQIIDNKELRIGLRNAGFVQLEKYSWSKTVAATKEVYKRLIIDNE